MKKFSQDDKFKKWLKELIWVLLLLLLLLFIIIRESFITKLNCCGMPIAFYCFQLQFEQINLILLYVYLCVSILTAHHSIDWNQNTRWERNEGDACCCE
jgi:chromate transport protein ChrA